jgi:hypothetical protein
MIDAAAPAFPRYAFVSVPDERFGELLQVEGVVGYVRNGNGGPAHVPDAVVAELLARSNGETLPTPEARCPFQRGERLIVRDSGVAAGHTARFERPLGGGLAVVLQEWLGRWVPVTVQIDDLDCRSATARGSAGGATGSSGEDEKGEMFSTIAFRKPCLRFTRLTYEVSPVGNSIDHPAGGSPWPTTS